MKPTLRSGPTATLDYRVPKTRTVPHLLPEPDEFGRIPPVPATGHLAGLVEWTCMRALSDTPPDRTVELTAVDGRRLTDRVQAAESSA
ncbi:hypothetical protein [Actinomadura sp. DC4]|uniref:hypothetical protein n=1 Tax=Actinomadura sp. DC4 TaxID=3055069 RepID=UPI0025AFA84F|nr:hypothetical protein [Actinomadura sp. DC4]MDN3354376.1 hypothetical protein [Actinomadura sp. DC4]